MHQTRGMRTIGNIVWFVVAGIWQAFGYAFAGVLCCLTIVGIPFGMQAFKLAGYVMWPFGRTTVINASGHALIETVFNVVWLFTVGWGLFVGAMVSAFVLCLTIIGIPFAVQCVKIGVLGLWPFGRSVVPIGAVGSIPARPVSAPAAGPYA